MKSVSYCIGAIIIGWQYIPGVAFQSSLLEKGRRIISTQQQNQFVTIQQQTNNKNKNNNEYQKKNANDQNQIQRSSILSNLLSSMIVSSTILILSTIPSFSYADDIEVTTPTTTSPISITPCKKVGTGPANCISTASVRQVDLYSVPWTWPADGISVTEVVGRLKGAIETIDSFQIIETIGTEYVKARGVRNLVATDEIEFKINADDRIITYKGQQVDGPDNVSDFGKIRTRFDEIRKRSTVLQPYGSDTLGYTADTAPRPQGTVEQLKAFWGLQSGSGFEDILLE